MSKKLAVIAIGGNSLITDKNNVTVDSQYKAAYETCEHIVKLIQKGYKVVITHGNGPQVGFILRRSEIASNELHIVPLDTCGADTQGAIGYQIQKAIYNIFNKNNMKQIPTATVITQTVVDKDDKSFLNPTKPIGSFMEKKVALEHQATDGWSVVEDSGRGWRRVVPSPLPIKIVELATIKTLLNNDNIVIAVGGGGIPVIEKNGELIGAEAVIDKDYATCLLAKELNADLFIISTAIDKVYTNYGKANQKALDRITTEEAQQYANEGHFAPGSMLPKINAIIDFVSSTGNEALITSPEKLAEALEGKTGTFICKTKCNCSCCKL